MSNISVDDANDMRRLRAEGKTIREIADIYGCKSTNAVSALILYGQKTKPVKIMTKPRDVLHPELYRRLPKGAVTAWRTKGLCLCGCGLKTSLRNVDSRLGRRGEPNMFKSGHDVKLYPAVKGGWKHKPASLEKMRASMLAKSVDASLIGELMVEYRKKMGLMQYELAAQIGISRSLVPEIESGKHPRIKKTTAVLILKAIGEEVPRHLLSDTPRKSHYFVDEHHTSPLSPTRHRLMYDGRAFQDYWGNVIWGRSPGEAGVGKCSCGVKSPVFEADRDRRRWHAEHRAEAEEEVA